MTLKSGIKWDFLKATCNDLEPQVHLLNLSSYMKLHISKVNQVWQNSLVSHEYSQNLHKQVGESVFFFRMADTVNSDISLIAAGGTNPTLIGSSPDSEVGNGRRRGLDTPGL